MNIVTVILSIIISICIYWYLQSKMNKKEFFIPTVNDGVMETPDTNQPKSIVEKNEVDYENNIYNTKYLMKLNSKNVKQSNKISFWTPLLDSGLYGIGTAIGKGFDTSPEKKYNAVSGPELRNPINYELVFNFNTPKKSIDNATSIIKNLINRTKEILEQHTKLLNSSNKSSKNGPLAKKWQNIINDDENELYKLETHLKNIEDNSTSFTIWKPIPPKNYKAIGYVLTNHSTKPMLTDVKCVPERCTREVRPWDIKDRVFVIEIDNKRLSIYRNPITMTLFATVETRVETKWVEEKGFGINEIPVLRLYPCLEKCNYVDNLIDADQCARNMCSNRKKDLAKVSLSPRKADTEEEKILLNEIKEQDEYLEKLKNTIGGLEKKYDKFNIVNKEYNRHEFAKYLINQEKLHKGTINKLLKSKNSVAVNINSPGGVDFLKKLLMDYLQHHAKVLKTKHTQSQNDPGTRELPPGCTNWTEFKKTHRCKYSDPPCFGCVNPT